jgi:hypothetical protein
MASLSDGFFFDAQDEAVADAESLQEAPRKRANASTSAPKRARRKAASGSSRSASPDQVRPCFGPFMLLSLSCALSTRCITCDGVAASCVWGSKGHAVGAPFVEQFPCTNRRFRPASLTRCTRDRCQEAH